MLKQKQGDVLGGGWCNQIIEWLKSNPGDYLEIGCYYGVFFSQVAELIKEQGIAYGIDPHIADGWTGQPAGTILSDIKTKFLYNIEGLANVVFWSKTTKQSFEDKNYNKIANLSCVLVDGSHHYDDLITDIDFLLSVKQNRDILVYFDDLHIPDVIRGIQYFSDKLITKIEQINSNSFIIKYNNYES